MRPVPRAGVFVGRENEVALLCRFLSELGTGTGNAVLIEGEPGIGKSALVRVSLAEAVGGRQSTHCGFQVFWGAGDQLARDLPLMAFADALGVRKVSVNARRVTIAGLLRGEVSTGYGADVPAILAEQLIALVTEEAAARPVVLIIDDLQWVDPASVKLWGRLARTVRDTPLLLVGMTRPAPRREDLLALRRMVHERARILLTALPQPAVGELVGALAGGRPDTDLLRLAQGAAGNPMYLTALIAALSSYGGITVTPSGAAQLTAVNDPEAVLAAVADCIGFLAVPTRDILRAAALLGAEFAVSDLATVLGKPVAALVPALDEARVAGVLTDAKADRGLAFRHLLIRQALYAELPGDVRGAWHRDAGCALATAGAAPERIARQLLYGLAGPVRLLEPDYAAPRSPLHPAAALEIERPPIRKRAFWVPATGPMDQWTLAWLTSTADSLVRQAPAVAAELLARAVAALPTGSARHGWLAARLAEALYRTGDHADAQEVAERALGYADDVDLVVDLHWTLAQCRMAAGSATESFATLDQALTDPRITSKHRGRLLVLAARTYLFVGDVEASGREATSALISATEAGDAWATGWALYVLAVSAASRGDLTEALPLYDRAVVAAETDPALYDLALLVQVNKVIMLLILDRCDEALATAERARQAADQAGTALRLAQAHSVLLQALHETGRWDDALAEIAVVPLASKDPIMACTDLGIAAAISFHRNQPGSGRRYLTDAEPYAQRVDQHPVVALVLARSLERERAGAPAQALRILTAAFKDNPYDLGEIEDLLMDAVRLAVKTTDNVTAQALTGQASALAEASRIPHRQATALYCQGLVDQAGEVLLAAAQRYADAGRPLPQAKALEAAARVLISADDRAGARLAFKQAIEIYEFLRAEADVNRVQAEFRARGIRRGPRSRHRRAASGWDSLTDTELKVAAFVVEGLTNPEIATRLALSPRTVATHVSHILKKLAVTTRTDIARESAARVTPQLRLLHGALDEDPLRTLAATRPAVRPVRAWHPSHRHRLSVRLLLWSPVMGSR